MKKGWIVFLMAVMGMFPYAEAGASVAIDWWGLWGANGAEFGQTGSSLYGEGFVDGGTFFTSPLFVSNETAVVENAYYTWSATGLNFDSASELAPGLWNIKYTGGTIDFYYDSDPHDIGGLPETQSWTNPRDTATFTDGTLLGSAAFTKFDLIWNENSNAGYADYEMDLGPGTSGLGGAFVSQYFIDPNLELAYVVDSDGSVAVIPEPGTLMLLGLGLFSFLVLECAGKKRLFNSILRSEFFHL